MFEQAAIGVQNEENYARLNALIDAAFDTREIEVFLSRALRARLGIRDFVALMERGVLGKDAAQVYRQLPQSDQALTRERYLNLVETVAPELRRRYAKVYASY